MGGQKQRNLQNSPPDQTKRADKNSRICKSVRPITRSGRTKAAESVNQSARSNDTIYRGSVFNHSQSAMNCNPQGLAQNIVKRKPDANIQSGEKMDISGKSVFTVPAERLRSRAAGARPGLNNNCLRTAIRKHATDRYPGKGYIHEQ